MLVYQSVIPAEMGSCYSPMASVCQFATETRKKEKPVNPTNRDGFSLANIRKEKKLEL